MGRIKIAGEIPTSIPTSSKYKILAAIRKVSLISLAKCGDQCVRLMPMGSRGGRFLFLVIIFFFRCHFIAAYAVVATRLLRKRLNWFISTTLLFGGRAAPADCLSRALKVSSPATLFDCVAAESLGFG